MNAYTMNTNFGNIDFDKLSTEIENEFYKFTTGNPSIADVVRQLNAVRMLKDPGLTSRILTYIFGTSGAYPQLSEALSPS